MGVFVISCLALFLIVFLLSIAVQVIRIERTTADFSRFLESHVTRMHDNDHTP